MTTLSEDLYGALWQIGSEQEIVGIISKATLARLAELRIVEIYPDGPKLTKYGERCYDRMEAGEGVPEFGETPGEF